MWLLQARKLCKIRSFLQTQAILIGEIWTIPAIIGARLPRFGVHGFRSKGALGIVLRALNSQRQLITYVQGTWKCVGQDSGTVFDEVELEEREWTDYDEKVSRPHVRTCQNSDQTG